MHKTYETILDSIADGVYTVDLDWRVTSFNKAAELITGISKKDAIGQSCFEVFRSNVCEKNCILRQTLETKVPIVNTPIYIIRGDKSRIPISATTAILKDTVDNTIGGVVTFRDLTTVSKLKKELLKQHTFEDIISKNARILDLFKCF